MDFVVALPESHPSPDGEHGFNAILVVVDRLTKLVTLIPTTTDVTAEGTAWLFWKHIITRFGVPEDIVTDRARTFVGKFFSELLNNYGIKGLPSTAYHPQTDGQTERVNRVLGDMLRSLVGNLPHQDWPRLLPAAEFAINNSFHTAIASTPFRLAYGQNPRTPVAHVPSGAVRAPRVLKFQSDWDAALKEAQRHMQAAQSRDKAYYDSNRSHTTFAVGDQVLLSTKHLRLRPAGDETTATKLLPKYIGPYNIIQVIGSNAYRLQLPAALSRIHNVFNVSLLRPYLSSGTYQPPAPELLVDDTGDMFLVEFIMSHRVRKIGRKSVREYLVKWLNYPEEESTWEPESGVNKLTEFEKYWKTRGPAPRVSP